MLDFGNGPTPGEVEVTLLGPGYGESVVIHATNNFWLVVDSCVPANTQSAAAVSYLNSIGVDLANVRFVVATHWHDDHVRGLAQVVEMSPNAKLVLGAALQQKEFMQIAAAYGSTQESSWPGASEIAKALTTIQRRTPRGMRPSVSFASAGKVLWDNAVSGVPVKIEVLSPSDADNTEAVARFAQMLPQDRDPVRRATPGKPNHVALAMHIAVGNLHILLGSDLEKTTALDSGWDAVLSEESRTIPMSTLYKVSHHGSITGHHEGIWNQLLHPKPLSILTPFRRGRVRLPKETDRQRIRSLSGLAYATSLPTSGYARATPEQRQLSKRAQNVQLAVDNYGVVRARRSADGSGPWAIEKFGNALDL
ncbi:MBL fold metallo-hydrolase [Burkholderia cenocepacia]|jgi:hypothetical protein|uniref:MBL fold metallo-hydrolase n=1 Tax=Burkholderia cenocepacia TaxID=95486 RepID=UPI001CF5C8DB|nr:MBL fold metallo-hydrolase [Burkholderia cenocepacia]MCA8237300.1 MBL fold metallo-hydrolase [Burkholderia cenocepacia]